MKYKLISGEIVDAEKDCECITHSDPHWIHENQLWQDRNNLLLIHKNYLGFAKEEEMRLKYKLWYMNAHNIERVIEE